MSLSETKKESQMKEIISCLSVPFLIITIFGIFIWYAIIRDKVAESRIEKKVHSEVLKGNKIAIAIKYDDYSFLRKRENEDLIMAALDGNESAIKALKIDLDRPNRKY